MGECSTYVFIVIFLIGNIIVLTSGIVFIVTPFCQKDYRLYQDIHGTPYLRFHSVDKPGIEPWIVTGGIIVGTSILGLLGYLINVRILSMIVLILYGALTIAAASFLSYFYTRTYLVKRKAIYKLVETELEHQFSNIRLRSFNKITFDSLEITYKCCGIQGPEDYKNIIYRDQVPPSCCADRYAKVCKREDAFQKGCVEKITDWLKKMLQILAGIGTVAAAFMFPLAQIGIYHACSQRTNSENS